LQQTLYHIDKQHIGLQCETNNNFKRLTPNNGTVSTEKQWSVKI